VTQNLQNLQNSRQSDEPAGPDPVIVNGFKRGFAAYIVYAVLWSLAIVRKDSVEVVNGMFPGIVLTDDWAIAGSMTTGHGWRLLIFAILFPLFGGACAAARDSWLETAPAAETTARRRYTTFSRLFSNGFLGCALGAIAGAVSLLPHSGGDAPVSALLAGMLVMPAAGCVVALVVTGYRMYHESQAAAGTYDVQPADVMARGPAGVGRPDPWEIPGLRHRFVDGDERRPAYAVNPDYVNGHVVVAGGETMGLQSLRQRVSRATEGESYERARELVQSFRSEIVSAYPRGATPTVGYSGFVFRAEGEQGLEDEDEEARALRMAVQIRQPPGMQAEPFIPWMAAQVGDAVGDTRPEQLANFHPHTEEVAAFAAADNAVHDPLGDAAVCTNRTGQIITRSMIGTCMQQRRADATQAMCNAARQEIIMPRSRDAQLYWLDWLQTGTLPSFTTMPQGDRERMAAFLDTALGVPYEPAVPAEPTSQYVAPRSRGMEIE
jgi:hypothetical protein